METLFESIKESKASDVLDGLNADMSSIAADALEEAKTDAFKVFGLELVEKGKDCNEDDDEEDKEDDQDSDDKDDEEDKESEDDE